jgi:hypothetical protein
MDSTFQFRARQATVSGLVRDRAKRRAPRFHPSIVSSRPKNRFAVRKFDEPPLTAE